MSRLSTAFSVVTPKVSREIAGITVPWDVAGYAEDFAAFQSGRGVFDLASWQVVGVRGPDARDFLHRLTTWDAKRSVPGRGDRGAVLNGRAHAIAMGWFLPVGVDVLLVMPAPQGVAATEHLEAMHFAENLTIAVEPFSVFASLATAPPSPLQWADDTQPFTWTLVPEPDALAWLTAAASPVLGLHLFEFLRLEAAIPEVGKELAPTAIVLEGSFDKPIARNKGCYPGQEVIERIFTYGQVNRRLYPIEWVSVRDLTPGVRLFPGDIPVVAAVRRPDGTGSIGLALFPRSAWEFPGPWTVTSDDGATVTVRRR